MRKLPLAFLLLFEDLFVRARAEPSSALYLSLIVRLGPAMKTGNFDSLEDFFDVLRGVEFDSEKDRVNFLYLEERRKGERRQIEIRTIDFDVLLLVCSLAESIVQIGDDELAYDFADSFHGISFAVQDMKLKRMSYSERYFDRFLAKWEARLPSSKVAAIKKWSESNRKFLGLFETPYPAHQAD